MNNPPSNPDLSQSSSSPQIKQEIEDSQGNNQQQAAVGDNNHQSQKHTELGEKGKGIGNIQDNDSPPEVSNIKQSADGSHNNQNQNTVNVNLDFNKILKDDYLDKFAVRAEKSKDFSDPTKSLPQKPKNLPKVNLDKLLDYSKKLQEDCLIVITCSDSSSALSVAYSLTDNLSVSSKRLFTGELRTFKNSAVEPSIDIIVGSPIGGESPFIVIVDTYEMQTFLDSLVVQPSTAALLKDDLKNRQIFCICLAESQSLKTTVERKNIKLSFPHWEIPFEQLEATQNESQSIISLYDTVDTLKKTVLYVATFFQNINIGDFERIVTLLLAEQTTLIDESERRTETSSVNSSEPTVSVTVGDQTITVNQPQKGQFDRLNQSQSQKGRLLRDIWEEDAEQILKSCYLELAVNEYSSRVIEFSSPNLRSELKQYFEDVKFIEYRNKFRKLVELNLLFDESSQVTKALKDLSVSMMFFQSGTEFWVNWLEQSTTKALECSTNRKNSDLIYYCIADLLRETLDHSELEDFTRSFLERLVSIKQHDAVLSISKRLRFSPQFDEYYWFKQSIDRGNEDVRNQAYQLLYSQIKQSKSRVYETFEKIHVWLPDLDTDPAKYSPSNKYALQLLFEYLIDTLEQFDPKLYGENAFGYPLFGGLRSGESIDRKLKMIVEWILHPGINSIIDDVDSLSIISILIFPGLFTILFGLKEDISAKPEFNNIVDSLLRVINDVIETYKRKTKIKYRYHIIEYWRIFSSYLLEASNYEIRTNKNWNKGSILNYRRNIIDYLIEKIDI
jgi:hypothetical protein